MMRIVVVESPYSGDVSRNVRYARSAVSDCLKRREAPYASHLIYTQPGVLDDDDPVERELGILAGFEFRHLAHATVVYMDHGVTRGMRRGIDHSLEIGVPVEYRSLFQG